MMLGRTYKITATNSENAPCGIFSPDKFEFTLVNPKNEYPDSKQNNASLIRKKMSKNILSLDWYKSISQKVQRDSPNSISLGMNVCATSPINCDFDGDMHYITSPMKCDCNDNDDITKEWFKKSRNVVPYWSKDDSKDNIVIMLDNEPVQSIQETIEEINFDICI